MLYSQLPVIGIIYFSLANLIHYDKMTPKKGDPMNIIVDIVFYTNNIDNQNSTQNTT